MSSLDYLDLCRLCLVKDRVSVPIFEDEGDVRQIFLKITACLPVKVSREDKLPKKICDDCVYKVELFYQFWNTTANAEKQLLQWLGEVGGLEDNQSYVTEVLNSNVMKQERSSDSRLDGSVMQVGGHQNNMDIGMIDNMSLITMPTGNEQFTSVPMDTANAVQTVQAVAGSSTQTSHDQITQNQTAVTHLVEEEEESEDEENSDDGCDNEEGLPVKEETEEDPSEQPLEPTTFVNVSIPCDEAGPSGLQQQKISEISELTLPQTADGDSKTGIQLRDGHRLVFQKKFVKIKPWKLVDSQGNLIRASSSPLVHVKIEPSEVVVTNDFEEVSIDGRDPIAVSTTATVPTVSNDVIVYMCNICKLYFPLKRMLEMHKLTSHLDTSKKQQSTPCSIDNERISYASYHKVKSGQYVCNYCPFHSCVRTTVSSHVARKHASLIRTNADSQISQCKPEADQKTVLKVEMFEDDDEDSWPMEVVEDLDANKTEEIPVSKIRACPYCSFHTTNSSTFHSHVKRKHRDSWLQSITEKVVTLDSVKKLNIHKFKCQRCSFVTLKRGVLRTHILHKHKSLMLELSADVKSKMYDKEKKQEQEQELLQEINELQEIEEIEEVEEVEELDPTKASCTSIDEIEEGGEQVETIKADTEADTTRKSQKCSLCPFESWINSTMQSHISRCHRIECSSSSTSHRRVLQLPSMTGGRRLPNAQLYTGYACHYCTFVAATVASINSHTGREHQGQRQPIKEVPVTEYDCDQCDYKSRNRRNMQLHVKRCHTAQANADGMFACHACSYETLSRMGLKRHISIKHNKPRRDGGIRGNYHECDQCDFKCLNGKTMDWHKRQHSAPPNAEDDGNSYFCNDCDFSTWTKGQLYLHIKRKHRDAEGNSKEPETEQIGHMFTCEQCDYVSKNKHVMKVHVIRKHTNDYNHECEICGKKYKIKADLTNHIRFQHREQPIICDVCGKTCRNSNLLYLHQKFAHYKPEFECPICHRRMVSQVNLDDHILKQHEQREDAVCEECGKKFTKQARLKIHMRIHTGIKPYTCKVCLKAFARRNGLRQHLLIHTGQRPYICDICGKSFTQKTGLICHRKSHPGLHPPLPRVTIDHVLSDLLNEEC